GKGEASACAWGLPWADGCSAACWAGSEASAWMPRGGAPLPQRRGVPRYMRHACARANGCGGWRQTSAVSAAGPNERWVVPEKQICYNKFITTREDKREEEDTLIVGQFVDTYPPCLDGVG